MTKNLHRCDTRIRQCLFCGSANVGVDELEEGEWHVACRECSAAGSACMGDPDDAVRAWNARRPGDAEKTGFDCRPCPFCGSKNLRIFEVDGWYVYCSTCDATGPVFDETQSERHAINMWNSRFEFPLGFAD